MKNDLSIKSSGSSETKMITVHATSLGSTVHILKTENWSEFRIIHISTKGTKCEFVADEDSLRAARCCLNALAEKLNWDLEEKST